MVTVTRDERNPILSPDMRHAWEAAATFNGCPIQTPNGTTLLYRAMSGPDAFAHERNFFSTIGITRAKDGTTFRERTQFIVGDQQYDAFGCEDPRVTKFGGTYYIFYTALGAHPFTADKINIALAISDDLKTVKEKHLITPFNAKAMALFPQKIGGKFAALLSVNSDLPPSQLCYVTFDKIEDLWDQKKWRRWYDGKRFEKDAIALRRKSDDHIELGTAPLLTREGWLVFYSHIQHYGSSNPTFGIEAVLLDKKNPKKIIGRTKGPLMVPEWYYEKIGMVQNITFPSGALIEKGKVKLYYGAADTHCAVATIPLASLLALLTGKETGVRREKTNPLLSPRPGVLWEARGVFNPAALDLKERIHLLYRAVDENNVSTLSYASSKDGVTFDERSDEPIYRPREDFERAGCEDPRLMVTGETISMLYTAYDGSTPRIAGTSISVKDFLAKRWDKWAPPQLITHSSIDDKDAAFIPKRFKGGYLVLHRAGHGICGDYLSSLDFSKNHITKCIHLMSPRNGMWDGEKIGISTPPIETPKGWLVLYHGVSWSRTYRVGAFLLDKKDPTIVKARTAVPFFEPVAPYELQGGPVPNVVFPCGAVVRKGTVYIYYGGADMVVGLATIPLKTILGYLTV